MPIYITCVSHDLKWPLLDKYAYVTEMSRLERIGKGVAIAAVGMFGINLIPHFKPSIPRKLSVLLLRFAVFCKCCTCLVCLRHRYQLEDAEVPEELEQHVKRIADAMVRPVGSGTYGAAYA